MNIIETNLSFGALSKRSKTVRIFLHNSAVTVLQTIQTIHNYELCIVAELSKSLIWITTPMQQPSALQRW